MVGVKVDSFVDDHRLYLSAGRDAKCRVFGRDDLTDISVIAVLLVGLVVIDVALCLGLGCSFGFYNLLLELFFQHSRLGRR